MDSLLPQYRVDEQYGTSDSDPEPRPARVTMRQLGKEQGLPNSHYYRLDPDYHQEDGEQVRD